MNGPALLTLVLITLLAGCRVPPRDEGHAQLQSHVHDRTGHRISWHRIAPDPRVEQAIDEILQRELSPRDAVRIALLNNARLQADLEPLGIAQADLIRAGALPNPRAEVELKFPGPDWKIKLTQDFLAILQRPRRRAAAKAGFEAAHLRAADAVLELAEQVEREFYDLLESQQMHQMQQSILRATDAAAEAAQRMHEAGNLSEFGLLQHLAAHEQVRLDVAKAEAEVLEHRERLNVLMGLWGPRTQWQARARLPELPRSEIEPGGLEALAMEQRLDLAAARQEVEARNQLLGLRRDFRAAPEFTLGVLAEDEEDKFRAGPMAGLRIPIFDRGQAPLRGAEALWWQSQHRYAALAVEIRSDVRRLRNRLMSARTEAEHHRNILLPLHHRTVEQALLHYNAMDIGLFELLSVKQAEIEAGQRYVESLHRYWVTRAELERAVGGHLPMDELLDPMPLPHEVE